MREILPHARRLMVFGDGYAADQVDAARKAAAATGFQLMLVQFVHQPYDYRVYFEDRRGIDADAFMSLASPIFARDREIIQEALIRLHVPAIGSNPLQAGKGYLLTLGSNVPKVAKRVADMGVRLLAGTNPSVVPVELADDFELVINSGTAQALGIRIPDAVRARAARILA
jgi:putative tryptophan/tyrosine transport system substrate-binding protein